MQNKIYNDDCFNIFPKLEKNSIDLVVVDLPFNQTSCKWDKDVINLDDMWKALKKICKKKCMFIFFCTTKFGVSLINSNPKYFRYDLVWEKSRKVGFLSANKMPLRKHEMIYVFGDTSVGKKTYNPQKDKIDKPIVENRIISHGEAYYGDKYSNRKTYTEKHPTTVLEFKNPNKPIHRTQKPTLLYEWLIKTYSNEGETVLDFCAGSMTNAIACLNTKRKYICIEKDKKIYELGKERVEKHIKDLVPKII